MKKILVVFLLSLFLTNAFAGFGGYIGAYDNRRYGTLSEPEYRGVVKLTSNGVVKGTGVFVSENIVLTNNHCVVACKNGCQAEFWNGSEYETSNLKILKYDPNAKVYNGTDWGLLLSDKASKFYKSIAPISTNGQVFRGGYGILRIIDDKEIPFLKNVYAKIRAQHISECGDKSDQIQCINRLVDKELEKQGKKRLFKDSNNFKVQICNIIGDIPKNNKMVRTDCDSSGGDSGAPLLRNNQIMALNNSGKQDVFGDKDANANAIKTENFYTIVQLYIAKYQNLNTPGSWHNNINDKNIEDDSGLLKADSVPDDVVDDNPDEGIQKMLQSLNCD